MDENQTKTGGDNTAIAKARIDSKNIEDHLSGLPIDCGRDIFERLDHYDLDEICTLNNVICRLTVLSRSRVPKFEASTLVVTQINENKLHLMLTYRDNFYSTELSENSFTPFNKRDPSDAIYVQNNSSEVPVPTLTESISDKAACLLQKFTFHSLYFKSIFVDDHFVTLFEQMNLYRSLFEFDLDRCIFAENLTTEGYARFVSHIFKAKPIKIVLNLICGDPLFYERIMNDLSKAIQLPNLQIVEELSRPMLVDKFSLRISQFGSLHMKFLVVNTARLMTAIIERLRSDTKGRWVFRTTTKIDRAQIESALDSDLKYKLYGNDSHLISISGISGKVFIKSFHDIDEEHCLFTAIFSPYVKFPVN